MQPSEEVASAKHQSITTHAMQGSGGRLAEGGTRGHRHIPWRADEPPPFFMPPGALGPNSPAIHMSMDALFSSMAPGGGQSRLGGHLPRVRNPEGGGPGRSWADEEGGEAAGLPAEVAGEQPDVSENVWWEP